MTKAPSRMGILPEGERTSLMLMTGAEELEKIMAERRLKQPDVADWYARHLLHKVWDLNPLPDDSRASYRDAILSFMSRIVDQELDGWGDGPSPRSNLSLRSVVDIAQETARLAGLAVRPQDVGLVGQVWASIEVMAASKPLIRALAGSALGSFDALTGTYVVSGADLVEGLPDHVPSHLKIVNAFVAPLRAQGFVVGVRTITGKEAHRG